MEQTTEHEAQWYYSQKGDRTGPVDFSEIERLVREGTIGKKTLVWNGEGGWKEAFQIPGLQELFQPTADNPPPLPPQGINNTYVWWVVAVPFIGLCIQLAVERELIWVYWILNIVFCVLDENLMHRQKIHNCGADILSA